MNDITENERRLRDVVELFAEIKCDDPRLMVVLAAGRIDAALMQMLDTYKRSDQRPPAKFQTRTRLAREWKLIDQPFATYVSNVRLLRNHIVHRDTRKGSLRSGPLASLTAKISDAASIVMLAEFGVQDRLHAAMVAGVLTAELDFFRADESLIPHGFGVLKDYVVTCSAK
tara:strand:- start:46190 stop:46702 length:513 start_codon:yes stop_codon:yes gene_type:complete